MKLLRRILVLTGLLCLMLSAVALAQQTAYEKISSDYQRLLGGWNAAYFSNPDVICAIGKLHVNAKGDFVRLPQGIDNFSVIDAGGSEAFLIIPRIQDTIFTLHKLDTGTGTAKAQAGKLAKLKGDTLVLFCNESDLHANVAVSRMVQNYGTRIISYVPSVNLKDGGLDIPANQQAFILDISKNLKRDGKIAYRKDKINNLFERYLN